MDDVLVRLRRSDKHYLGSGDGVVFDPSFPLWLDRPGFWDGGRVFLYALRPLFTLTFADPTGRERPLRPVGREWTPAELVASYESDALALVERRVVLPGGIFASEWRIENRGGAPVELAAVAWTVQDAAGIRDRGRIRAAAGGVEFRCHAADPHDRGAGLELRCGLGFAGEPASGWGVYESQQAQDAPDAPIWEATPFRDRWLDGGLAREVRLAPAPAAPGRGRRVVYLGISRALRLAPGETLGFTVLLEAVPADPAHRLPASRHPGAAGAAERSRGEWQSYFAAAPSLTADDAYLERYFAYRWYGLRLKGIDITIYAYRLRRALARVAARLGRAGDGRAHDVAADRIADAVLRHLWDPDAGLFSDVEPGTMRRTGVKAAVSFYPYLTDIVGPEHLGGLERNLFDAHSFWLPYPVPSTAADDPTFDPDATWRGVRRHCTWNGRVWPMVNSHLVDALGAVAERLDAAWRERTVELLRGYIRMLFLDGDPARPTSFEHYSPHTGRPSVYRGIDDYQHSWINDLVIRYVAGFRPRGPGGFTVDPFPFGLERLRLDRLPYRGTRVGIAIEGERFRVEVDGRLRAEGRVGEPLEVSA